MAGIRLSRWGNSAALRVPKHVLDCAALKIGDAMYVNVQPDGALLVRAERLRDSPASYVPGNAPAKVEGNVTAEEKW